MAKRGETGGRGKGRGRRASTTRAGAGGGGVGNGGGSAPQPQDAALAFSTDAWRYDDVTLEDDLLAGRNAAQLENYFGPRLYQELRGLKQQERRRAVRGGPRVLIVPGIMGSKLGRKRLLTHDTFWLDPLDFLLGHAKKLILEPGGTPGDITPVGVFLFSYLKLKLKLRISGYDADFYPFDWRQSLDRLGAGLKQRIADEGGDVALVAHSMGGLVSRAAIKQGAKVRRLIMLGTPNFGSFSPVQALRATHSMVIKLARLARTEPETLTRDVFSTFPGLYQMLPSPLQFRPTNFFDPSAWPSGPANRPQPRPAILSAAANAQNFLAAADERFFLVAGVNRKTIVAASLQNDDYVYEESMEGDGTVPLAFAQLTGTTTYYVEESHGSLPNNGVVFRAVKDLLERGSTDVLPSTIPTRTRAVTRVVREAALEAFEPFEGRRGGELRASEVRHVVDEVASPDSRDEVAVPTAGEVPAFAAGGAADVVMGAGGSDGGPLVLAGGGAGEAGGGTEFGHRFDRFTVSRSRQHRIRLQLYNGSITEVEARAYVVGVFHAVAPSGAALAIDARLDGAIGEFTRRRMFSGAVGETFMMPAARRRLRSEFVLFAGLGDFDRFNDHTQQLVSENVVRTFLHTRVEDFATVLMGSTGGQRVEQTLFNLLTGFIRGLIDADDGHRFRCVTICENDAERYQQVKRELFRLSSTQMFKDVEVTFDELEPEEVDRLGEPFAERAGVAAATGRATGPDPTYLLVRQESVRPGSGNVGMIRFFSSLLTAGSKATVMSDHIDVAQKDLDAYLGQIEASTFSFEGLPKFGADLASLVLPPSITEVLASMKGRHVVVVHDPLSSRLPWESLRIDEWTPALAEGISHRYLAGNLSVAKFLEQRKRQERLEMLLVVNPTLDLPGAEREGKRIKELFETSGLVNLTTLHGANATRPALLSAIGSGQFDVLHYAGHAFFDANERARSGLLAANRQVVSGADLAAMGNLPSLAWFNACESGRVRSPAERKKREFDADKRFERNVGMAEAFLRGGVANYIGTYWPVGDSAALQMAEVFYKAVLTGKALGEALAEGRQALQKAGELDWADYIHYGDHEFVLKETSAVGRKPR